MERVKRVEALEREALDCADPARMRELLELAAAERRHGYVSPDLQRVFSAIGRSKHTPADILDELATGRFQSHKNLLAVTYNAATPAWLLHRLSEAADVMVRVNIASNPNASDATLTRVLNLAVNGNHFTAILDKAKNRYGVLASSNPEKPATKELVRQMLRAYETEVRAWMAENLVGDMAELAEKSGDLHYDWLINLLTSHPEEVEMDGQFADFIIDTLRGSPAPEYVRHLYETLLEHAEDKSGNIGQTLLTDLYALIAANPNTPADILRDLIYSYGDDVDACLLDNPACPASILEHVAFNSNNGFRQMQVMVHPAATHEIMHAALVRGMYKESDLPHLMNRLNVDALLTRSFPAGVLHNLRMRRLMEVEDDVTAWFTAHQPDLLGIPRDWAIGLVVAK